MKQCMDAENLHRRLKKIIGQVQAIDRMIDEDVPCEDVIRLKKRLLSRELCETFQKKKAACGAAFF